MMVIAVFGILYGMMFCMMFPVLGLQMLCSAVAMILLSRLLSEYRRKMTFLCYPPVFPAYPVGQCCPAHRFRLNIPAAQSHGKGEFEKFPKARLPQRFCGC